MIQAPTLSGCEDVSIDRTLARLIDHTQLKPEATVSDIERLCSEARHFGFASVCVNPTHVALCARLLSGSAVKVCTVVGFPLGATTTAVKAYETEEAIRHGAQEIDMVINIGMLKSGDRDEVERDIRAVVDVARRGGALTKVILETALLSDAEKEEACRCSVRAGAAFVKTSTGFSKSGATASDVALMRRTVGPTIGVKAAGGIRTRDDALTMVRNGATRIGASASIHIVTIDQPTDTTTA